MEKTPQELYKNQGKKVEKKLKDLFGENRVEPGTSSTAVIHLKGGGNTTLKKLSENGYIIGEIHKSRKDSYKYRAFVNEAKPVLEKKEVKCRCCGQKTTKNIPTLKRVKELKEQ